VLYQEATIRLGQPFSIEPYRQYYHGRQASTVAKEITATLSKQVADLLTA
jgi:hypothetical protein